jgi:hypothetical protein
MLLGTQSKMTPPYSGPGGIGSKTKNDTKLHMIKLVQLVISFKVAEKRILISVYHFSMFARTGVFWPPEVAHLRSAMELNTNDLVVVIVVALILTVLLVTHFRPETRDDVVVSVQLQHGLKSCQPKPNIMTGRRQNSSDAGVPSLRVLLQRREKNELSGADCGRGADRGRVDTRSHRDRERHDLGPPS